MARKKKYDCWLPKEEMEALARCFLPAIQAFYKDENNIREFEEWKKERDKQLNENDSSE